MRTDICNRIRDLRVAAINCDVERRHYEAVGDIDQADRFYDKAQEYRDQADALALLLRDIP